jgi:hypothetical protein
MRRVPEVPVVPWAPIGREGRAFSRRAGIAQSGGVAILGRGWGSSARTDTHLTYMIDIAMTTEFEITAGDLR